MLTLVIVHQIMLTGERGYEDFRHFSWDLNPVNI